MLWWLTRSVTQFANVPLLWGHGRPGFFLFPSQNSDFWRHCQFPPIVYDPFWFVRFGWNVGCRTRKHVHLSGTFHLKLVLRWGKNSSKFLSELRRKDPHLPKIDQFLFQNILLMEWDFFHFAKTKKRSSDCQKAFRSFCARSVRKRNYPLSRISMPGPKMMHGPILPFDDWILFAE